MLIDFTLQDMYSLVDNEWDSYQVEQDYMFNHYFCFTIESDTGLFLIKKILVSFQYSIVDSYEDEDGDMCFITNVPYDDVIDICSGCRNLLCNRCSSSSDSPENEEIDNNGNQTN
jgi:hypothetical protein